MASNYTTFDQPYNMAANQNPILNNNIGVGNNRNNLKQLDVEKIYGIDNQATTQNPTEQLQENIQPRESFTTPVMDQMEENIEPQRQNTNTTTATNNENTSTVQSPDNNFENENAIPEIRRLYNRSFDSGFINNGGIDLSNYASLAPNNPEELNNLNGFIKTQIGRKVTVDFLLGTNTLVSKTGYLVGVASDFIVLNELNTNDITTCDFDNIKFIRFYY